MLGGGKMKGWKKIGRNSHRGYTNPSIFQVFHFAMCRTTYLSTSFTWIKSVSYLSPERKWSTLGILYGIRQVRLMNFKLDNIFFSLFFLFFFFLDEWIVQRDKCILPPTHERFNTIKGEKEKKKRHGKKRKKFFWWNWITRLKKNENWSLDT